jgi:hypothetical protein
MGDPRNDREIFLLWVVLQREGNGYNAALAGEQVSAILKRNRTIKRSHLKQVFVAFVVTALAACGGGNGDGGDSSSAPGTVSLGLSDAPVGNLSEVVITIDGIELRRKDGDDCDDTPDSDDCAYIDQFTLGGEVVDTIQVDLLTLQGSDNQIIVEGTELEAGEYDQLRLSIIDEDTNYSWVKEEASGDTLKLLKVPGDELKLGGFVVESGGVQVFIIEFNLHKAMTYNPDPDRYILKPRGVRIVEVESAASIAGTVGNELFNGNTTSPCVNKADFNAGNVIYLYRGHGLNVDDLADNFDRDVDDSAPDTAIAPFASETVAANGSYEIAYLPAGEYTLAFTCEAEQDDAELLDGIVVPSPDTQIVEVDLAEGETRLCNLPVSGGSC